MKSIDGNLLVGAPFSLMRYQSARRICADCLDHIQKVWCKSSPHYEVLSIGDSFATMPGTCHVCEQTAPVAVVKPLL